MIHYGQSGECDKYSLDMMLVFGSSAIDGANLGTEILLEVGRVICCEVGDFGFSVLCDV